MSLLDAAEARERIVASVEALPEEFLALTDACDRVLSRDLRAQLNLPVFNNSAMDGYAVRSADLREAAEENPVALTLVKVLRAGNAPGTLIGKGQAAPIMTGAPLPSGADAVVMRELTQRRGRSAVVIAYAPKAGDNVRLLGTDIRAGRPLLKRGTCLRPYEVALLAAQGFLRVPVTRGPHTSILVTGDEIQGALEPLLPGKIRDAIGPALACALRRWGSRTTGPILVRDDPRALRPCAQAALESADMVLISGGVSAGDFDFTRGVLSELGVREIFWKAAIKPGKPLFFGIIPHGGSRTGKPVFGLPGNPVAALVCLEEFVRPALEKLQGFGARHPSFHLRGQAVNDYPKLKDRRQYLFCRAEVRSAGYDLHILRPQGSAMLGMACSANALAVAPAGDLRVKAGDPLDFRWLK